jgi:hypothetical protein
MSRARCSSIVAVVLITLFWHGAAQSQEAISDGASEGRVSAIGMASPSDSPVSSEASRETLRLNDFGASTIGLSRGENGFIFDSDNDAPMGDLILPLMSNFALMSVCAANLYFGKWGR